MRRSLKNISFTGLENSQTYFLAVQVQNKAGLWSETGFSDGIITAFTKPKVILFEDYFTSSNANIDVSWTFQGEGLSIIKTQWSLEDSPTVTRYGKTKH